MTCEHRFVAFPGSVRSVFCERCGALPPRATGRAAAPPGTRASRRAAPAPPAPRLPLTAAYEDRAEDEMSFAERVAFMVGQSNLSAEDAAATLTDALEMGEAALDLDTFARQLGVTETS